MAIDKVLLRKAICSGAFRSIPGTGIAMPIPVGAVERPFSPKELFETLTKVSEMSETEINAKLELFVNRDKIALQAKLDKIEAEKAKLQAELNALNGTTN